MEYLVKDFMVGSFERVTDLGEFAEGDRCIVTGSGVVSYGRCCTLKVAGGGNLGDFSTIFGAKSDGHVWR